LGGWQGYSQHPDVILAMKRMYRQKGRAQLQATPLTRDILTQLLAICSDDGQGMRDRVLLHLGYETMRRRSELCNFRFDNIRQLPNGLKAILLTRSKTDQYGQGKLIALSDHLSELLSGWHQIAGNGYILRGLPPHQPMTPHLAPASINSILQRVQRAAGLTLPQDLSGHSFRVGRALDLLMDGEPLEKIMLRAGWKSESTAMRYLRAWSELG
jgi:integrase